MFRDHVLSELLPPLETDGTSKLWEALGRQFTGLTYQEADRLSKDNKEFIHALFPDDPIHTELLPDDVRAMIGQVGEETRAVEKMLRRIGFDYAEQIDPFDGGPHFIAKTDDDHDRARRRRGRGARGRRRRRRAAVGDPRRSRRRSAAKPQFRAIGARVSPMLGRRRSASPRTRAARLGIEDGQKVWLSLRLMLARAARLRRSDFGLGSRRCRAGCARTPGVPVVRAARAADAAAGWQPMPQLAARIAAAAHAGRATRRCVGRAGARLLCGVASRVARGRRAREALSAGSRRREGHRRRRARRDASRPAWSRSRSRRAPYRGRLRARDRSRASTALACFWNEREPAACEAACTTLLGARHEALRCAGRIARSAAPRRGNWLAHARRLARRRRRARTSPSRRGSAEPLRRRDGAVAAAQVYERRQPGVVLYAIMVAPGAPTIRPPRARRGRRAARHVKRAALAGSGIGVDSWQDKVDAASKRSTRAAWHDADVGHGRASGMVIAADGRHRRA